METVDKSAPGHNLPTVVTGSQVLGVFAKQPVAGRVKTRLCPPLTFEQAATFYEVCLQETLARLRDAAWPVVLFFEGDPRWFAERFPALPLLPQGEGDLGVRMGRALETLLQAGARSAGLVGTDSPDLPLELVEQAMAGLEVNDAVTIPADDGGYVLVGWRRPCPQMFEDIPWSSDRVLELTRQRAARAGLRYLEVGHWYDLDDAGALTGLLERSPGGLAARHLRQHLPGVLPVPGCGSAR
ncbi:MAG: TIGR04282 family arsenosugar biosynthesis glycosyltransferase [Geothermobacteraceae bacterium]